MSKNSKKLKHAVFKFQEESLHELNTATSELDDKTKTAIFVLRDKVQNVLYEFAEILNDKE